MREPVDDLRNFKFENDISVIHLPLKPILDFQESVSYHREIYKTFKGSLDVYLFPLMTGLGVHMDGGSVVEGSMTGPPFSTVCFSNVLVSKKSIKFMERDTKGVCCMMPT